MANQQFKVRHGLVSSGNVTLSSVSGGTQAAGGKILVLDTGSNVVYRTISELNTDLGSGGLLANTNILAGNGVVVTFPSGSDVQIEVTGPQTLNTSTASATTNSSASLGSGHSHAITYVSDASTVTYDTILAANAVGGIKLATIETTGNVSFGQDVGVTGNVSISGSLQVDGTLTYVNTTNLQISDPLITLSEGFSGSPTKDQGLLINRGDSGNAAVVFDESADEFVLISTTDDGGVAGNLTISDYLNLHAGAGTFDDTVNVGANLAVTGMMTFGTNQEVARLANSITVADSSSGYLFEASLSDFTGAEVVAKIKAGSYEQQVRKFLIAENGQATMDYTEYGAVGHDIGVTFTATTTDGAAGAGTSHFAVQASNSDGAAVTIKFIVDLFTI